ncbi:O-6-alkylguanine-DNA alkyltransferase [Xylocopa sonorina]|uniref:O-6-alkylguanine-DNA alkyltransferase n=1 Tax=Xylocopa sonorina TaxID=1818115 RepID=UPI00403A8C15
MMVNCQTITPEEYKTKRENHRILYAFHPTPFGDCLLAIRGTDKAVVFLSLADKYKERALAELRNEWPLSELMEDATNKTKEIVQKIFSERVSSDDGILVALKGTEFEIAVWKALLSIPKGTTVTYGQVASNIGKPKAVRAVANAVMKNNVGYLVPCHRVVSKSGENKYKWGTDRKEAIQVYERNNLNTSK